MLVIKSNLSYGRMARADWITSLGEQFH